MSRFILDNDVDIAGCRAALQDRRHLVIVAAEAGVEGEDEDVTSYAHTQKGIVVTHDAEFSNRRRRRPDGLHIRLKCLAWDGEAALQWALPHIEGILTRHTDLTVEISPTKVRLFFPNGGNQVILHPDTDKRPGSA